MPCRLPLAAVAWAACAPTVAAPGEDERSAAPLAGAAVPDRQAVLAGERRRADPAAASGAAAEARASVGAHGVAITSADGRFALELGGRLHVDWTKHAGDSTVARPNDGTDVRRARIEIGGRFDEAWRFAAETDLAGDEISPKDLWLGYDVRDGLRVTFGHQKQPYSLVLEMSSNDIAFVERGIDNALIAPFVDRAIGVRADAFGATWFAAAGIYGESIEDGDEGWGTAGRFVLTPIAAEDRVLHVGVRAAYREPDSADAVRIRAETTSFSDLAIVDTAPIAAVESVTLLGPEGAFATGPFSLAGEYNRARIEHALGRLSFDSWHVAATWSLTGESRAAVYALDEGEFKRLEPTQPFSRSGGAGAWELAARYASIDLNDDSVTGGEASTLSLGVNWYPIRNVRLMLDWMQVLHTDESSPVSAAAEGIDVVTLRAQYVF